MKLFSVKNCKLSRRHLCGVKRVWGIKSTRENAKIYIVISYKFLIIVFRNVVLYSSTLFSLNRYLYQFLLPQKYIIYLFSFNHHIQMVPPNQCLRLFKEFDNTPRPKEEKKFKKKKQKRGFKTKRKKKAVGVGATLTIKSLASAQSRLIYRRTRTLSFGLPACIVDCAVMFHCIRATRSSTSLKTRERVATQSAKDQDGSSQQSELWLCKQCRWEK